MEPLLKPTQKSADVSSRRSECRRFSLEEIKEATHEFDPINVLGGGAEGTVYEARFKLDGMETTRAAVKHLKHTTGFEQELKVMSEIQHPNVLSLIGYCNERGWKILVYEFMEKGNLAAYTTSNYLRTFLSWQQWLNICLGAALGLQHLHHVKSKDHPGGIIHRDIKPDNILLDANWVAKISDFGVFKLSHAGRSESSMFTNLKGTSGYWAPEYFGTSKASLKVDVYSFGVVLFEVLCGRSPYAREDEDDDIDDEDLAPWAMQNVHPEIQRQISDDCLKAFTELIGKCLKKNKDERPMMDAVVLALQTQVKSIEDEEEGEESARESEQRSTGSSLQLNSSIAENDYSKPIVIDVGGAIIKAGFQGDLLPRTFVASQVRSVNPIKDGIVSDWASYQRIVRHALSMELKCDPKDKHPILLTEPPLKHNASDSQKREYRSNRENMTEIMFDKLNVPALYIGMQPVLSLLAHGHKTGIVVESGEGISYSVPIYEGHALPHAITGLDLAGRGLTQHLADLLYEETGYSFSTRADLEIVRQLKEKMTYVALNYERELRTPDSEAMTYTLPDGELITIDTERFKCPESLFSPNMVEIDEPGIHAKIHDSIKLCDEEIWNKLYATIVLSGGTTLLPGFGRRIEREVSELAPSKTEINVLAKPKRKYGAWFGGSVLASLNTFPKVWISKEEYEEYGPYGRAIVHRKCL